MLFTRPLTSTFRRRRFASWTLHWLHSFSISSRDFFSVRKRLDWTALRLAAKRGVDVRIFTPGIPDKKTVFAITRSYYSGLVRQGVRIFEFTPGFCHAKVCLCDGTIASVGTSNLDYRSLYHHFENNVLFTGCDAIKEVAADFEDMFRKCTAQHDTNS